MDMAAKPATAQHSRQFLAAAALVLALSAAPRLWAAWFDNGVFWPDEIFQSVEQGHRAAFGYGVVPWEFRRGARSWVFPGLLAGLLRLGALFGLDSGRSLMLLVKTSMALISLAAVYLAMRLARALAGPRTGPRASLVAGLLAGFFPASILFSARCLAETVSATALMGVVLLARKPGRNAQLAAGALAGLAIFLRYQNGLIAVGMLAIVASERRFRDAAYYAAASGAVGVLGGLLDWFTWGKPFGAFKMYLYFNLFKSADKFGAYPFGYYAGVAWQIAGPALIVIAVGLIASARLAPKLLALVVLYVLIHSIVPHKEFRFLMPVMPLALALSGAGLCELATRVRSGSGIALGLAALSAAWMAFNTTTLTWGSMGFPSDRGARSAWHSGEGINLLLAELGEKPDVCGVIVTGESFGWIGGYSYFHRDVNMFPGSGPAERAAANYFIAKADKPAPERYAKLDQIREFALYKREGACAPPPPGYARELPY
jgi:phosphatidylinositol glycan class B